MPVSLALPLIVATPPLLADERLLWFLNRGTGLVLLLMLTLSMALGVLATLRVSHRRWPRFVTRALHRNVSMICLVLLVAHVATAVLDERAGLTLADAFVPFLQAGRRPVWGTLATVSLDLLLVAALTGLLRHRLGRRSWKAVHLAAYGAWPLALAHGLGMGTDRRTTWSTVITLGCVGAMCAAGYLRFCAPRSSPAADPVRRRGQPRHQRGRSRRPGSDEEREPMFSLKGPSPRVHLVHPAPGARD